MKKKRQSEEMIQKQSLRNERYEYEKKWKRKIQRAWVNANIREREMKNDGTRKRKW